jgi:ribosomal protein L7Ae-like RNA K-turn-binding protein
MKNCRKDDLLGFIGLLYVGHKAMIGEELLTHFAAVKLLLVASDAVSNQAIGIKNKAVSAHLPIAGGFTKAELGEALGYEEVNFLGIVDAKAAGAFLKKSTEGVNI